MVTILSVCNLLEDRVCNYCKLNKSSSIIFRINGRPIHANKGLPKFLLHTSFKLFSINFIVNSNRLVFNAIQYFNVIIFRSTILSF